MDLVIGIAFSFEWEIALISFLQSHMNGFLTGVASFMTLFGEEVVLVGVMCFLYWCYDKEFGRFVGLNLVTACCWSAMVKNVFFRRRPYFDHPEIRCLRAVDPSAPEDDIIAQGWSFPSGHSSSSTALFSSLPEYRKKSTALRVIGVLIPFLVGVSRSCLGVHYPTDVLAGWILGLATIALTSFLQSRIRSRLLFYLILLLSAVPGLFFCSTTDYFTSFGLLLGCVCGFYFEERIVRFRNTRQPVRSVLRLVCGIGLFLVCIRLTKLPFSEDFLNSVSFASRVVRVGRYALAAFAAVGLYPMSFRFTASIGRKE